jgi:DNA-binding response OmpR family regulator
VLELGAKDYFVKAQFDPEEVMVKARSFLKKHSNENQSTESPEAKPSPSLLEGKKIMWVEDDSFLSDIIARKLAAEKCTLLYAKDTNQAVAILDKDMPDIILLDVLLPGVNGFEFLEKLKSDPKTKDIPVIMLSNLSQDSDVEKGKKLGAARFLIKATIQLDEVIEVIGELLSESKKS